MSLIEIKFQDRVIQAAIKRLQKAGSDLKPAMQDIGEYLIYSTKKRFAEGKAPDGTPWEPNTEATIAAFARRKKGGSSRRPGERGPKKQDLGATGKKPLIGESKRLSTEIHYRADANSVAVGSSLEQAAVMQFGAKKGDFGRTKRGASIPFGDIPARPYLGLADDDKAAIVEILKEHLTAVMGGNP